MPEPIPAAEQGDTCSHRCRYRLAWLSARVGRSAGISINGRRAQAIRDTASSVVLGDGCRDEHEPATNTACDMGPASVPIPVSLVVATGDANV